MSPIALLIVLQFLLIAAFMAAMVLFFLGIIVGIGSHRPMAGDRADPGVQALAENDAGENRASPPPPMQPRTHHQHGRTRGASS